MDKTSLTLGWLIGRRIARYRVKKTPIAYLFNGVQLPTLPEWDKKTYPYAVINTAMYTMFKSATLYLLSSLEYTTIESNGDRGIVLTDTNHVIFSAKSTDTAWSEGSAVTAALNIANIGWTNTDILNDDGTTYLSASDPIPVYETADPEQSNVVTWIHSNSAAGTGAYLQKISDRVLTEAQLASSTLRIVLGENSAECACTGTVVGDNGVMYGAFTDVSAYYLIYYCPTADTFGEVGVYAHCANSELTDFDGATFTLTLGTT